MLSSAILAKMPVFGVLAHASITNVVEGDYDFYVETSKADLDEIAIDKLKILDDLHASPEFEGEKLIWLYVQQY